MLSETPSQTVRPVRRTLTNFYWVYGVTLLAFILDQLSKFGIEQNLGPYLSGKSTPLFAGLTFEYVKNSGASYNFLRDVPWLFTIVAIVAAIGVIGYYQWQGASGFWYKLSVGLILGGIIGNLSDRLFKGGYVTDFIHISWLGFFNVFNLADSCISVAVAIVLLTTLLQGVNVRPARSKVKTDNSK